MSDIFTESEVANRYAKALFELADEQSAHEAICRDLATLKAMLISSADFRRLLASAQFSNAEKLDGLFAVTAKASLHTITRNSLSLLAKNGRLLALGGVINAYQKAYDAQKGVVAADVISAVELSAEQLKSLKSTLLSVLGREAILNLSIDPALLGGLKVRIGSRLFDASLKTKLDGLKFALRRA